MQGTMNQMVPPMPQGHYMGMNPMHSGSLPTSGAPQQVGGFPNGLPNMQAKSEMNLKFFNFINSNYSKRMQKAGYDVEDVKTYDRLSEEEKLERKLNPKEHGVDAYVFKKKKEEELSNSIKEKQIIETKLSKDIEEQIKIKAETNDLKSYTEVLKENKELKSELKEKNVLLEKLQKEVSRLTSKINEVESRLHIISSKIGNKILKIFHLENENVKNEYPDPILLDEINEIQNGLSSENVKNYRIVPDEKNDGCYKIVDRKNGKKSIIKDNLKTRREAEKVLEELKLMIKNKDLNRKRSK